MYCIKAKRRETSPKCVRACEIMSILQRAKIMDIGTPDAGRIVREGLADGALGVIAETVEVDIVYIIPG